LVWWGRTWIRKAGPSKQSGGLFARPWLRRSEANPIACKTQAIACGLQAIWVAAVYRGCISFISPTSPEKSIQHLPFGYSRRRPSQKPAPGSMRKAIVFQPSGNLCRINTSQTSCM